MVVEAAVGVWRGGITEATTGGLKVKAVMLDNGNNKRWMHPGGKLIDLGPSALSDEELLAVIIGAGYKGRTAQDIARDLLNEYYSIPGLMGKKLTDLAKIKGLKDVKVVRIAAAFEIARRVIKALDKE
jgi:DNA repair protein RadC